VIPTVGLVGWTVSCTGSTAAKLHRHLSKATAGQQVPPDIAKFIEACGVIRAAWEAGVMSSSGHADVPEVPAGGRWEDFEDGVSTARAADLYGGTSARQIRRWAADGRLRSRRVGRDLLVSEGDVIALREEHRDAEAG
jgi:hypothetical protein